MREQSAVRIALFEAAQDEKAAHNKSYEKAKSGSSIKGHEGRKTKMRVNLPKVKRIAA